MIGIIILVYILVVVLSRWQKAIWVRCQATRLALWLALDLGSIRNKFMEREHTGRRRVLFLLQIR